MKRLTFFILMLMLTCAACSPMKRLDRLQRNHPYMFLNDTIVVNDTVIIAAKHIIKESILPLGRDTSVSFSEPKNKISGQVKLKYLRDTVYMTVEAQTEPDTIPYQKSIYVNNQPLPRIDRPKTGWLIIGIAVGLIVVIFLCYTFKR